MSAGRRWRAPKAKDGQLKAQWGKLQWNDPDLCYVWGAGIQRCDSSLLHSILSCKRMYQDWNNRGQVAFEPSFIDELKERGYDITTLKFSIQKKQPEAGRG